MKIDINKKDGQTAVLAAELTDINTLQCRWSDAVGALSCIPVTGIVIHIINQTVPLLPISNRHLPLLAIAFINFLNRQRVGETTQTLIQNHCLVLIAIGRSRKKGK